MKKNKRILSASTSSLWTKSTDELEEQVNEVVTSLKAYYKLFEAISETFDVSIDEACSIWKTYLNTMNYDGPIINITPELVSKVSESLGLEIDNAEEEEEEKYLFSDYDEDEEDEEDASQVYYLRKIGKNKEVTIPTEIVNEFDGILRYAMDDPYHVNRVVIFDPDTACKDIKDEYKLQKKEKTLKNVWNKSNGSCTVKLPDCFYPEYYIGKMVKFWYDEHDNAVYIDMTPCDEEVKSKRMDNMD